MLMPKMLLNYFLSYNELIRQQRDSGYLAHQLLYQEATASFENTSTSINAFPVEYSEILNLCQCVSLVAWKWYRLGSFVLPKPDC